MKASLALCLAAILCTTFSISAATYTWQNAGSADWTNAANWNPSTGYPSAVGDEMVLPQLAGATYDVNLQPGNAVTVGVIRMTSDANQSYRIRNPVSSSTRSDIYLDNSTGNARIEMLTSSGNGKLTIDGQAAARHRIYIQDDLDIVVSNGSAGEDFDVLRVFYYGTNRTISKYGEGTLRMFYTNTDGTGLDNCLIRIHEGEFVYARNNVTPNCTIEMMPGTIIYYQYLNVGHLGDLILRNNTLMRAGANGVSTDRMGDILIEGDVEIEVFAGNTVVEIQDTFSGTGTVTKTGVQTNYFTGAISPGASAGTISIDESQGAMEFGRDADTVELLIEDGDLLELTSFDTALDLSMIDATFLDTTAPGTTNWFLTCDAGIANTFNSENYTNGLSGTVIYDTGNNRVGAVVVPEGGGVAAVIALIFTARRRKMRG
jgi:hypothetical protein